MVICLTLAEANTTLLASRLTQVFVEVRPKSTLRIFFPVLLLFGTTGLAFIGVDADTLFIGIAAAFIGVAAEGWSVMEAPSNYLALTSYHADLTKMRVSVILARGIYS
jgi:hypothetical protein